jgi:hypothetical protein
VYNSFYIKTPLSEKNFYPPAAESEEEGKRKRSAEGKRGRG